MYRNTCYINYQTLYTRHAAGRLASVAPSLQPAHLLVRSLSQQPNLRPRQQPVPCSLRRASHDPSFQNYPGRSPPILADGTCVPSTRCPLVFLQRHASPSSKSTGFENKSTVTVTARETRCAAGSSSHHSMLPWSSLILRLACPILVSACDSVLQICV